MSCCVGKRQTRMLGFRIIDAASGKDIALNEHIALPGGGTYSILSLDRDERGPVAHVAIRGRVERMYLPEFTDHPQYPGQRILIVPT